MKHTKTRPINASDPQKKESGDRQKKKKMSAALRPKTSVISCLRLLMSLVGLATTANRAEGESEENYEGFQHLGNAQI